MTIDDWRRAIDEIDRKLIELLNERSRCVFEIGRMKRASGIPLYQPEREREIFENVAAANQGPLSHRAMRRLFERILDEARSLERQAIDEPSTEPAEAAPADGKYGEEGRKQE